MKESNLEILSPREKEIVKLISEGLSSHEIADSLNVALRTIKAHRANIHCKLGIHKLTDLIKYAIKTGLAKIE